MLSDIVAHSRNHERLRATRRPRWNWTTGRGTGDYRRPRNCRASPSLGAAAALAARQELADLPSPPFPRRVMTLARECRLPPGFAVAAGGRLTAGRFELVPASIHDRDAERFPCALVCLAGPDRGVARVLEGPDLGAGARR